MFADIFGDQPGHTFSLLYNAWAESSYGEKLSVLKPSIHNLHADSGGLQMVTLAHKLPKGTNMNDLREEVYHNQAEWSDVGMCFDEIPVITVPNMQDVFIDGKKVGQKDVGSGRNDTRFRYFDKKNRHKYAQQTADNIARQIKVFKRNKSSCKAFMICQGGDLETYLEWVDTILTTVPKEDHHRIGGVAMGGAALGTGPLEDIQKAFFASQVPVRDENGKLHLHVLGVGSISRIIPYLIFLHNGLYGNVHISYDSTTHTRGVETGMYYIRGKIKEGKCVPGRSRTMNFTRSIAAESVIVGEPLEAIPDWQYDVLMKDINRVFNLNMTKERFHECLNNPTVPYMEKYGELKTWYTARTALCCVSIKNFMDEVEELINNPEKLFSTAIKHYPGKSTEDLFEVTDIESFNKWMKNYAVRFKEKKKSKSISHTKIVQTYINIDDE
jgi:hypothetical protein